MSTNQINTPQNNQKKSKAWRAHKHNTSESAAKKEKKVSSKEKRKKPHTLRTPQNALLTTKKYAQTRRRRRGGSLSMSDDKSLPLFFHISFYKISFDAEERKRMSEVKWRRELRKAKHQLKPITSSHQSFDVSLLKDFDLSFFVFFSTTTGGLFTQSHKTREVHKEDRMERERLFFWVSFFFRVSDSPAPRRILFFFSLFMFLRISQSVATRRGDCFLLSFVLFGDIPKTHNRKLFFFFRLSEYQPWFRGLRFFFVLHCIWWKNEKKLEKRALARGSGPF